MPRQVERGKRIERGAVQPADYTKAHHSRAVQQQGPALALMTRMADCDVSNTMTSEEHAARASRDADEDRGTKARHANLSQR